MYEHALDYNFHGNPHSHGQNSFALATFNSRFELSKGGTQRCDCGFYFKLIDYDPLDKNLKPTYGKGFGSGMSKYY